jgi:hypothetical protein
MDWDTRNPVSQEYQIIFTCEGSRFTQVYKGLEMDVMDWVRSKLINLSLRKAVIYRLERGQWCQIREIFA